MRLAILFGSTLSSRYSSRSGTSGCRRYTETNSSGKLNGDPKWFTPPLVYFGFVMSYPGTLLPSPKIPGPDANTEYHSVDLATSLDLPKFCTMILFNAFDSNPPFSPKRPFQLPFIPR